MRRTASIAAFLIANDRELVSIELPVVNIARENGVMPALPSGGSTDQHSRVRINGERHATLEVTS